MSDKSTKDIPMNNDDPNVYTKTHPLQQELLDECDNNPAMQEVFDYPEALVIVIEYSGYGDDGGYQSHGLALASKPFLYWTSKNPNPIPERLISIISSGNSNYFCDLAHNLFSEAGIEGFWNDDGGQGNIIIPINGPGVGTWKMDHQWNETIAHDDPHSGTFAEMDEKYDPAYTS